MDDLSQYPKAKYSQTLTATESGYLSHVDTMALGFAGIQIGAGRRKITDAIDYSSGMYMHARIGDNLGRGDDIITVYSNDEKALEEVMAKGEEYFSINQSPPEIPPLILERIE